MARTCTVCSHERRADIDSALVAAAPYRDIAGQHGLSRSAVQRHHEQHLPATLARAKDAAELAHADTLLDQVKLLRVKALSILERAEGDGDLRTALAGLREVRGCLELLGKLVGELDDRPQINIALSGEWLTVRGVLLDALTPFPEARAAVASRLLALEAGNAGR